MLKAQNKISFQKSDGGSKAEVVHTCSHLNLKGDSASVFELSDLSDFVLWFWLSALRFSKWKVKNVMATWHTPWWGVCTMSP